MGRARRLGDPRTAVPLATPRSHRAAFERLTDPDRMLPILQRELGALTDVPVRVTDCRAKAVRSRSVVRDRQLHIAYRTELSLGGTPRKLVCLGLSPVPPEFPWDQLRTRAEELRGHPEVAPFRDLLAHVPELDLALVLFPLDPALQGLAAITGARAESLLAPHLPECREGARITRVESDLRHYKPFNRAVLRITAELEDAVGTAAGERSVYVKLFADDRGAANHEELTRLFAAIREARALHIPEPLGYDSQLRMMVMSESPGQRDLTEWIRCIEKGLPFPDGVDLPRLQRGISVAAEALYELQSAKVDIRRRRDFHSELEQLGKDRALLADIRDVEPELVGPAERLLERLEGLTPAHEDLVPAHGGFRHKQTVGDEENLSVIDWDGLCLASPALDAATFTCRLRQEPLLSAGSRAPEMEELAEQFRREFLRRQPALTREGLALYEGLVLTERTLRTFRRPRRPGKGGEVAGQIELYTKAAHECLDRSREGGGSR